MLEFNADRLAPVTAIACCRPEVDNNGREHWCPENWPGNTEAWCPTCFARLYYVGNIQEPPGCNKDIPCIECPLDEECTTMVDNFNEEFNKLQATAWRKMIAGRTIPVVPNEFDWEPPKEWTFEG